VDFHQPFQPVLREEGVVDDRGVFEVDLVSVYGLGSLPSNPLVWSIALVLQFV
jgi:hypothetical protein